MVLCERCKKEPATLHVTNLEADGKTEVHLCDRCSVEEGYALPSITPQPEVLSAFVSSAKAGGPNVVNLICENCGISYVEFRNQGLLGCGEDYDAFKEALAPLIERAQDGATQHRGKTPKTLGLKRPAQDELRLLKRQLEDAVAAEDYERAATLRDRIRALESP